MSPGAKTSEFTNALRETSKQPLRQTRLPERGEAVFAPTDTASMKNQPVKDRTSYVQG
jgi:hypothetical protein